MTNIDGMNPKKVNALIAHLSEVHDSVKQVADELGSAAKGKLAAHHKQGHASISITEGSVDAFVNLDDSGPGGGPAAAAIEFGHFDRKSGRFVDGLHVLTGGL